MSGGDERLELSKGVGNAVLLQKQRGHSIG